MKNKIYYVGSQAEFTRKEGIQIIGKINRITIANGVPRFYLESNKIQNPFWFKEQITIEDDLKNQDLCLKIG